MGQLPSPPNRLTMNIGPILTDIKIWQQNTRRSLDAQLALLNSLKNNLDIVCIHEPHFDFLNISRATRVWHTVYPTTPLNKEGRPRALTLIHERISTNKWTQIHSTLPCPGHSTRIQADPGGSKWNGRNLVGIQVNSNLIPSKNNLIIQTQIFIHSRSFQVIPGGIQVFQVIPGGIQVKKRMIILATFQVHSHLLEALIPRVLRVLMGRFRGCKTYETQPFGILEFFVSPYSLQLLATYVHIMIFAFLDPCISTTKRRYFNISCCCLTLCTIIELLSLTFGLRMSVYLYPSRS